MESEVFSPEEICLMRLVVTFRRAFSSGNESPPRQVIHESRKKMLSDGFTEERLAYLTGLVVRADGERRLDEFESNL